MVPGAGQVLLSVSTLQEEFALAQHLVALGQEPADQEEH